MGFDCELFPEKPHPEFLCSICGGVLENPTEVSPCQHIYCRACITDFIKKHSRCPIDHGKIVKSSLREPDRFFKELYAEVQIRCDAEGCGEIMDLEKLQSHITALHDTVAYWKTTVNKRETKIQEQWHIIDLLKKALEKSAEEKKVLEGELDKLDLEDVIKEDVSGIQEEDISIHEEEVLVHEKVTLAQMEPLAEQLAEEKAHVDESFMNSNVSAVASSQKLHQDENHAEGDLQPSESPPEPQEKRKTGKMRIQEQFKQYLMKLIPEHPEKPTAQKTVPKPKSFETAQAAEPMVAQSSREVESTEKKEDAELLLGNSPQKDNELQEELTVKLSQEQDDPKEQTETLEEAIQPVKENHLARSFLNKSYESLPSRLAYERKYKFLSTENLGRRSPSVDSKKLYIGLDYKVRRLWRDEEAILEDSDENCSINKSLKALDEIISKLKVSRTEENNNFSKHFFEDIVRQHLREQITTPEHIEDPNPFLVERIDDEIIDPSMTVLPQQHRSPINRIFNVNRGKKEITQTTAVQM